MMPLRALRLLAATLLLAVAASAAPRDPAAAELLFREGRKAFDEGRFEEACAKFAESQRLDPGAGTLINLAACEEQLGRLASAWEKWQQALRMLSRDDERRVGVEQRSAALESRLPRLEIRLSPTAPPETFVKRDGIELGRASLGLPLPVDPGAHRVEVQAPGRESRTIDVTLAEAEKKSIVVEPGPPLPQPKAAAPPRPAPPPPPRRDVPSRDATDSGATLGWVVAGVGAVGIVVGAVAGVLAIQKKSEVDDDCSDVNGTLECGQAGLDAADAGGTYATVSTVAFAVGIAGLGVGGYLVLTAPDAPPTAAALGISGSF